MAAFPLKSILKPTIPVSPLRPIPPFEETRKRSSVRNIDRGPLKDDENEPNPTAGEGVLIDFSTPTRTPVTGTDQLANPFEAFNASSAIRDAKQREEKERRERERRAILEQREVRRKSMGEF
jgi:kinetochore protein Spc7/SPC105